MKYLLMITNLAIVFSQFGNILNDENIIVLVGPDNYYQSDIEEIANFHIDFANSAGNRDNIFIVISNYNDQYYVGQVPNNRLIYGSINDIWVRDFSAQQVGNSLYKFEYSPQYLDNWTSNWIENSYTNWLNNTGIEFETDQIVLDGGNFTTDGISKAVITTRVFEDNPSYSEIELREYFVQHFNITQIAFTPEEPGDLTGHSDGQVFWITPNKLAVCDYEEPYRSLIYEPLLEAFPEVEFIDMVYAPSDDVSDDGFLSVEGIYVNALRTTDNIYVPIYDLPEDSLALAVFAEHSSKNIIPVDASEIAIWGGSVHCLSWEYLRASEIVLVGDINSDGLINVQDIILVVGIILSSQYDVLADVNNDGSVNVLDVVSLINIILEE